MKTAKTNGTKKYYAGKNRFGINRDFRGDYWQVYRFATKTERDAWVAANEYDGNNFVAGAITRKTAELILGSFSGTAYQSAELLEQPDGEILRRLI